MPGLLSDAQVTFYITTIARSLDKSLSHYRKSSTRTYDGYGHDTTVPTSIGVLACNVIDPTASQLELYAGVIASREAVILRVMQTSDVVEGDEVDYDGFRWTLHSMERGDSYTWTKEMLAVRVT